MDVVNMLATEIAKGLIATGIEGAFDSVSCSTAGNYPSMGCSQWEGERGNQLLTWLDGGHYFIGRSYSDICNAGELPLLRSLLGSAQGQAAQQAILADDCKAYVKVLQMVPTLDDTRCMIYAGMWCPTSHRVVSRFLHKCWPVYNLRSLLTMRNIFRDRYYIAADVGEMYYTGYANRAQITYEYVAALNLTAEYGVPAYGFAGNGR